MHMLWDKFKWILPPYTISFQSNDSIICSVTTTVFIDFLPDETKCVFPTYRTKKTNEYLNSVEQIIGNWNVSLVSVLITSLDIAASTNCEKS